MIRFIVKDDTFFIFARIRTSIYDSRTGFMDLKALNFEDEIDIDEEDKLKAYIKPILKRVTNRNTITKITIYST